jgi:hypothetical protein
VRLLNTYCSGGIFGDKNIFLQEKQMRRAILGLGLVCVLALASVSVALAHHSFAAEFDSQKRATKQGFVTKVDWQNPHVWIYFDVKDATTGKIENWGFEMGPPHLIQNSGWTRTTLKYGDEIIVTGSLAKNGTKRLNAGQNGVKRANGQALGSTGSSEGVNP